MDHGQRLVSVILVTHNGHDVLNESLSSIRQLDWPKLETIIVDNASTDDTLALAKESMPTAHIIALAQNRGYGAGGNQGAKFANGDILFFMNQDVALSSSFMKEMVTVMNHDGSIGVCGGTVLSWDRRTLISIGQVFERWTGYGLDLGFGCTQLDLNRDGSEIFSPNGAGFAIRRTVFQEIGGFNEDLFMYFDETDLSWRARIAGFRVVCARNSILRHMITPKRAYEAKLRYYIDRNSLLSAARNYELSSLIVFLPTSIAVRVVGIIALTLLGRREHASSARRALSDFLANLPRLRRDRRFSAKFRRVSDKEVMRKEVLAKPSDILKAFSTSMMPNTA